MVLDSKANRSIMLSLCIDFCLYSVINEPCHEVMVYFILCKLIFQTRMHSDPVGLDV